MPSNLKNGGTFSIVSEPLRGNKSLYKNMMKGHVVLTARTLLSLAAAETDYEYADFFVNCDDDDDDDDDDDGI